ncbi:RNA methyltransferase [Cyclobacterium sp. 1_MG-2023]|uniref:RNA methyltransferase n=1 Tax=Cyclobacterium sp. 1_MG-2023 TaxID=3062681 RepID=UPI0026E296AA|nr:RNA methyltransferase [Cyclobacterium sp. 1_MG-2023]MDO6438910.1 RNA methyltransferase [Cyclobacterium sp. 1_MG-2023]
MKKLSMEELNRLSVEDYKEIEKNPIALVLDNVRSLNNVGSAFRTSDAFLVKKIFLCGITGKPPHREIQKTALGATESVDWEHHENTLDAIKLLKKEGYEICVLEQASHSTPLNEFVPKPGKPYAFVFGNEVFGVEEDVVLAADQVLEIPQFGTKHSLNISVSIGITLWDMVSKTYGVK